MKVSGRDDGFTSWVPVTLLDLIEQEVGDTLDGRPSLLLPGHRRPSLLPLGDRFSIARKLAQTLYVMHAMGWVHKK